MSTPHPEVFDIRDARVRISDLERELAMEKSASAECVVQMVRSGVTSFGYLKDAIRVLGEQRDAAQSELAAERTKYAALTLAYERTDSELKALKAELTEANAVLHNPEKWHKWCDIRVLEQLEAAQKELAARERQLVICEAVVDQHADTILKLREELARARDDEARECAAICHDYAFDQRRSPLATGGAFACKAAIELRIAERAK